MRFPALLGRQGGVTCYTAVLTLRQLVDVLPAPDRFLAPEKRAQRTLSEARAHEIADYMLESVGYAIPPITLSASRLSYEDGVLAVSTDAVIFCNDGQHRRRGIEIAIEERPELADDTVTAVFYEDSSLPSMQQRFADLNSGQPAARSVRLLYDLRRPSKGRKAALLDPFAGLVEMQASNAAPDSGKIWTLSGLDRTPAIEKFEFWIELFGKIPSGTDIRALRKSTVWAHNVGLQGIGFVAEKIPARWIADEVNWSRDNPEWEGRAQRGGKMLAARRNAVLIANLLLQKYGLPLPPQHAKIEAAHGAVPSIAPPLVAAPVVALVRTQAPAIIKPTHKLDLGKWAELYASGPFAFGDVPSFAGISFGRTSAVMSGLLDPRVTLCFENTGKEDERTLEFGARLQDALQREIVWLEFRPPKRKGAPPKEFGFEVVTYETACRDGAVFEAMLDALAVYRETKGLPPVVPSHAQRICTAYLKHRVQRAYMESLGVGIEADQIQYIGLRADEPDRLAKLRSAETGARSYMTPLADVGVTKTDVLALWKSQAFDLELPNDYDGNCTKCFEKDDAQLSRKMGEDEADAAWWIRIQKKFPGFGGRNKHSYEQLLHERETRLSIEAALRAGEVPADDGRLTPRRFKLVVINEKRFLAGETANFSCACEASLVQSEKMDEESAA